MPRGAADEVLVQYSQDTRTHCRKHGSATMQPFVFLAPPQKPPKEGAKSEPPYVQDPQDFASLAWTPLHDLRVVDASTRPGKSCEPRTLRRAFCDLRWALGWDESKALFDILPKRPPKAATS